MGKWSGWLGEECLFKKKTHKTTGTIDFLSLWKCRRNGFNSILIIYNVERKTKNFRGLLLLSVCEKFLKAQNIKEKIHRFDYIKTENYKQKKPINNV